MKQLLNVFIYLLLLTSCDNNRTEKKTEANNNFSQIKIERYAVKEGNADNSSLASYIIKEFNDVGLEAKSVYYTADDQIMMQFVNQFNNGNKTQIDWINGEGDKVKYVKMTYNDKDELIKSESFNTKDEFVSGFIHQWKDDGKTEEKGPIEGTEPFRPNAVYKYNDQKEFVSLVEYDDNDSLYGKFTWNYLKFDNYNEWIERHMFFNDTLIRIEKRIFTYK
ncbi:hypothetical protein [Winogradskyella vincentii]|uniref:Lipoprotein n=1 Tax=Winogradskyella vincentii TaxID=2877122 RepID=A0ABS7Y0R6_9FLAO|nr:hypothetical protein [Winogradskyella vincentii]MCA0153472.1 hypothetical protein [Winogradskyella vincentii]